MNLSIFREYDIRGVYPSELDENTTRRIAGAFGSFLIQKGLKKASVGSDVRISSPIIRQWFIESLINTGIDVVDIGTVATPVCYFSAFHLEIDGFCMITASHNPKDYNGFKLGLGKTTIYGSDIIHIKDSAQAGNFSVGKGSYTSVDMKQAYLNDLVKRFQLKKAIRLVVDPANATGCIYAKELYEGIGANVTMMNDIVDGTFPSHHPDPTIRENMEQLSQKVKETGATLGIGLDGDSDRIGVVDENGKLIPGDLLTLIFARDILQRQPGAKIIFEVKSSLALDEGIRKAGGIPIMWKVGHSLLKKKMQEEQAPLAGEVSGHIFFAENYYGYDDALYAGCRLLSILDQSGKTLTELLADVPPMFNTPEIRCECENDEAKFVLAECAIQWFKAHHSVVDIDGVRIIFEDGWALVRASNTQPSLVTRFESTTQAGCDRIQNYVLGKLQEMEKLALGQAIS